MNEVYEVRYKFCSIRIHATKYDVTFATGERGLPPTLSRGVP